MYLTDQMALPGYDGSLDHGYADDPVPVSHRPDPGMQPTGPLYRHDRARVRTRPNCCTEPTKPRFVCAQKPVPQGLLVPCGGSQSLRSRSLSLPQNSQLIVRPAVSRAFPDFFLLSSPRGGEPWVPEPLCPERHNPGGNGAAPPITASRCTAGASRGSSTPAARRSRPYPAPDATRPPSEPATGGAEEVVNPRPRDAGFASARAAAGLDSSDAHGSGNAWAAVAPASSSPSRTPSLPDSRSAVTPTEPPGSRDSRERDVAGVAPG